MKSRCFLKSSLGHAIMYTGVSLSQSFPVHFRNFSLTGTRDNTYQKCPCSRSSSLIRDLTSSFTLSRAHFSFFLTAGTHSFTKQRPAASWHADPRHDSADEERVASNYDNETSSSRCTTLKNEADGNMRSDETKLSARANIRKPRAISATSKTNFRSN